MYKMQSLDSYINIYLREVESRPPPPVIGDCVNRVDVHRSVEGLYISCSYSSYKKVTADDDCIRGAVLLLFSSAMVFLSVDVYS